MCANYEPIARSRAQLLNLFEPTFDYKTDIYPNYEGPILFFKRGNIEWRLARFGLVAPWLDDIKKAKNTYNARTETVDRKPSFRNAWKKNQFCLIPVETIFEPKYIDGKSHRYGIYRRDEMPFTVAGIYEYSVIDGQEYRSMSMLTINSDLHPFMNQFHAPEDEKRSIIVIPQNRRNDWLNCNHEQASEFFFEMPTRQEAEDLLNEWLATVPPEMNKSKKDFKPLITIFKEWRNEILNYFDYRVTNGYTEALNGVAKVINRQGRGYNFETLRARLLFNKHHKPPYPSLNMDPNVEITAKEFDDLLESIIRCECCLRLLTPFDYSSICVTCTERFPHLKPYRYPPLPVEDSTPYSE